MIETMIRFLREDLIKFNKSLGVSGGIRDIGLLESAINAPFQTFGDVDLFPSVYEKAARLLVGIAKNHPFVDGNKRTAIHAMSVFLVCNKFEFHCSDKIASDFVIKIVESDISIKKVSSWIQSVSDEIPKKLKEFLFLEGE